MKKNVPLFIILLISLSSFGQSSDSSQKKIVFSKKEEIITDSIEYKKETVRLMHIYDSLQNEIKKIILNKEEFDYQIDLISGPINFFNRIERNGGKATERDKKFARAAIQIIDKQEWLPEIKRLASKSRLILVSIECCL